jgi:hypothetical protein
MIAAIRRSDTSRSSTGFAAAVCEGLGERIAVMTKRFTARLLAIYLGTLCPIALLLGMMVVSIDRAARIPLRDSRADAAAYVLGLLATGAIGHIFATIVLPRVRSKVLVSRGWAFPVACGIAYSLATATACKPTSAKIVIRHYGGQRSMRLPRALIASNLQV